MKSWKTTVLGVCAIIAAVIAIIQSVLSGSTIDWGVTIAAIMAGLGNIAAKDANVTGGTK